MSINQMYVLILFLYCVKHMYYFSIFCDKKSGTGSSRITHSFSVLFLVKIRQEIHLMSIKYIIHLYAQRVYYIGIKKHRNNTEIKEGTQKNDVF